jgi:hypothetical protein
MTQNPPSTLNLFEERVERVHFLSVLVESLLNKDCSGRTKARRKRTCLTGIYLPLAA